MAEAATIARPYAKAAFLSARDSRATKEWSAALQSTAAMVADPRIAALLASPKVSNDEFVSLFAGLGGRIEAQWQNFIRLLAHNKRLAVLPSIAQQYDLLRAQSENELDVQVTSAVALNAEQESMLAASLKKRFRREVRMSTAVDAALLGGAVIRAGDLVIDGSIKGRLQRLASELSS